MSNVQRRHTRRWKARNAVAVSVIWAGLATGAVTERAAAASPPNHAAASAVAINPAAKTARLLQTNPVALTGATDDGAKLAGAFQLRRFQARNGVLYAVGRLSGTLGAQPIVQTVRLPITAATNDAAAQPQGLQAVPTPGACSILNLHLGPLDLNLLGLHVALDQVNLLIEAIPGADALLGNLLCAVAGLLNGGLGGGLGNLLNNLLTAIGNLLNGLLGV